MKPKLTLLTALAFASVMSVAVADEGGPTRPARQLPEKLKPYDVDGDGRLSREEYKAFVDDHRPEAPRSPWDTDGDGKLSEEEIAAARAAMRAKLLERYKARFEEADTNDDGSLSYEEFRAMLPDDINEERAKAAFDRLESDEDEDDVLSLDEFLKFHGLPLRPDRPDKPDRDKPKPERPERPALPEKLKAFDTNNDGILSRDEIKAAIEAGTWPGRPKPPGDCHDDADDDGGTDDGGTDDGGTDDGGTDDGGTDDGGTDDGGTTDGGTTDGGTTEGA